jgi:hypothetical protein
LQGCLMWALHYGAKFRMHVPTHVFRYSTNMWSNTQVLGEDDVVASADDPTILARTPYDFNRGEKACAISDTRHPIAYM